MFVRLTGHVKKEVSLEKATKSGYELNTSSRTAGGRGYDRDVLTS